MTSNTPGRANGKPPGDPIPTIPGWWIYQGTGAGLDEAELDRRWPDPPPWRDFRSDDPDQSPPPADDREIIRRLGTNGTAFTADMQEASMVNAAVYLRRPLLVTGRPGAGKSSLAYRISAELRLGRVLRWPISSRSTLRSGLAEYDAIGRAQAVSDYRASVLQQADQAGKRALAQPAAPADPGEATGTEDDPAVPAIGDYLHMGPLGTALLPCRRPRVLLIDELDKSDIDLPNDLLNIFEDGEFVIPELVRASATAPEQVVHTSDPGGTARIRNGIVRCHAFPIVVITSNGERAFPPAFLRRCLQLEMPDPDASRLAAMASAHFPDTAPHTITELVDAFQDRGSQVGGLAADQLLNAVHLATSGAFQPGEDAAWTELLDAIWHRLSPEAPQ